jgi:hypothetical protein
MMSLAMGTARPTAWSPHSVTHLINANLDAALSSFGFLSRSNPTDPFVACQWGKCFPKSIRQTIGYDCFLEIIWKFVHNNSKASF